MIVAAIPVKALGAAKGRLAGRLSPEERRDLVIRLLLHTVRALRDSRTIDRIAVVTPERGLADYTGAEWLPDAGSLNDSLAGAVQWALSLGARSLLLVPGDLPHISGAEVRAFLEDDPPLYGIAIAGTSDGGTGALLLTPPHIIPPAFGPGSYQRHLELARLQGVRAEQVTSDAFAFDVDTPPDLALL